MRRDFVVFITLTVCFISSGLALGSDLDYPTSSEVDLNAVLNLPFFIAWGPLSISPEGNIFVIPARDTVPPRYPLPTTTTATTTTATTTTATTTTATTTTATTTLVSVPGAGLTIISEKTNFQFIEDPSFIIQFPADPEPAHDLADDGVVETMPRKRLEVFLLDSWGNEVPAETELTLLEDGRYSLQLTRARQLRAGKYTLVAELTTETETFTSEQDFTWGVLAVNTHKSVYLPNEEAFIGIAVLDDAGHMVCDADITLTIEAPGGEVTELSTDDATIILSEECEVYGVTNLPDYYAYYDVEGAGTYRLNISALTYHGTRSISDSFMVEDVVEFDVARDGPTRIYPFVPYRMGFTIKSTDGYTGVVTEKVPASFEITPQDGMAVAETEDSKLLAWAVDIDGGGTAILTYEFDAPDISPYMFLLGPLELGGWQEGRYWMIASDAGGDLIDNSPWTVNDTSVVEGDYLTVSITFSNTDTKNGWENGNVQLNATYSGGSELVDGTCDAGDSFRTTAITCHPGGAGGSCSTNAAAGTITFINMKKGQTTNANIWTLQACAGPNSPYDVKVEQVSGSDLSILNDYTGDITIAGLKGLGEACSAGPECSSDNCIENVCCDTACGSACQSCLAENTPSTNGTCDDIDDGFDPYGDCTVSSDCNDGLCNGAGACGWITSGEGACPSCKTCDGASSPTCMDMVDETQDTQGSNVCSATCENCNGAGSCVNQLSEDLFNDCDTTNCGTGLCQSGAGVCDWLTSGEGECAACGTCDSATSLSCVNIASNTEDNEGSNQCTGLCVACQAGSCDVMDAGTDPDTDCTASGDCNTGNCKGVTAECGWATTGEGDCAACGTCQGATSLTCIDIADNTRDVEGTNLCSVDCKTCNGTGSCVDQDYAEDLFDQCDTTNCGNGTCTGAGACGWITSGEGNCAACGTCDSATSTTCESIADHNQDTQGSNQCTATCKECDGAGTCANQDVDQDYFTQCGALGCDGGASTPYYWGWSSLTCYYALNVSAADAKCSASGSCKTEADYCGSSPSQDGSASVTCSCVSEQTDCANGGTTIGSCAGGCPTPPNVTINAPANQSTVNNQDWALLNWTIGGTGVEVWVYGSNDTSNLGTSLLYHRTGISDGDFTYNWSSPVIQADSNTVVLLHFDNLSTYGENDTLAYDFSGSANNATLNGTTFNSSGKMGGAFQFDGTMNAYGSIEDDNATLSIQNYTLALWVRREGPGDPGTSGGSGITPEPLLTKGRNQNEGQGNDSTFYLGWEESDNTIDFDFEDAAGPNHATTGTDTTLTNDVWYHVVVTHNYSHSCVYIDSVLDICNNVDATPALNDVKIGIGTGFLSTGEVDGAFNGSIDEVVIYNRSFSASEVQGIYNLSMQKYYWKVNATISSEANDSGRAEFTLAETDTAPTVTLNLPADASVQIATTVTINCSATDNLALVNLTLYGNWTGAWTANETNAVSGTSNSTTFTPTLTDEQTYIWNCLAYDDNSNSSFASANRTFTVNTSYYVSVAVNSPANESTIWNQDWALLNWTLTDTNMEVKVFGSNDSSTLGTHMLLHNYSMPSGTYTLNWSTRAIQKDTDTRLLYHFDNRSEYGEGTDGGDLVNDFSDTGVDGYLGNITPADTQVPTWTSDGRLGGAFVFNAGSLGNTGDCIRVPANSELNPDGDNFSIVFWLKYSGSVDGDIYRKGSTLTATDWYKIELGAGGTPNAIGFNLNTDSVSSTTVSTADDTYNDSQWHHFALVRDRLNGYIRIYADGVEVANETDPAGVITNTANASIGCKDTMDDDYLNGTLDEFAIFGRTLSPTEIGNMYNLSYQKYYWKVNITSGSKVNDSDVYEFTTSASDMGPVVSLNSPENDSTETETNVTFNCSATDDQLLFNITLYGNWTGSWASNGTNAVSGTSNSTTFEVNFTENATYLWNCLAYDNNSNGSWASANYTFEINTAADIAAPTVVLDLPANNTIMTYYTDVDFNCTPTDTGALENVSLYFSSTGESAEGGWTAYNDAGCDSGGGCSTGGSYPNVTNYNAENYGEGLTGELRKYSDNLTTDVTLTISGSGTIQVGAGSASADPPNPSDAYDEFDSKVSFVMISYGTTPVTMTFNFTGLTSTNTYRLVTTGIRDSYADRYCNYTLLGATSFTTNSSSATTLYTIYDTDDTTNFNCGDNTPEGYVAGWRSIDPEDTWLAVFVEGSTSASHKSYLSAIKLVDESAAAGGGSTSWHLNETVDISGTENATGFTKTLNDNSTYDWNCYSCDTLNQCDFAPANYTFKTNSSYTDQIPTVTLNLPGDDTTGTETDVTFNCTAADDYELENVTLYGNWTGSWVANESTDVSGTSNTTTYALTLSDEQTYLWNCLAYDNSSNSVYATANYTYTINSSADVTKPNVTLNTPGNATNVATFSSVSFNCTSYDENALSNVTLYLSSYSSGTLNFRENGQSVNETDDSTINGDNPTWLNGTNPIFEIDGAGDHTHAVLRFTNIFGGGSDQIPYGATITSANLTLHITSDVTTTYPVIYILRENWTESEVTFNNRTASALWGLAGADGSPSADTGISATILDSDAVGDRLVNITHFVQNWSDGADNFGMVITHTGSSGVTYDSSEHGTTSYRPLLTVAYTSGATFSANESADISGTDNSTVLTTGLSDNTTYTWNCRACDVANNCNFSDDNYTVYTNSSYADTAPIVALNLPADGTNESDTSVTFNCSATDEYLVNITLYGNFSGSWAVNETAAISGTSNSTTFNLDLTMDTTYIWNCESYDNNSASSFAAANYTFRISDIPPIVTLNTPTDTKTLNYTNATFNCSATDGSQLVNLTLYGNWSGSWAVNGTISVSGTSNSTTFDVNFTENATYLWNCMAYDNASQSAWASANYTLQVNTSYSGLTYTIAWMSDARPRGSGTGEAQLTTDFNAVDDEVVLGAGRTVDVLALPGDMDYINQSGQQTMYDALMASDISSLPFYVAVGNHELDNTYDMPVTRAMFAGMAYNPTPGPPGTANTTYFFEIGDMRIIMLNVYWDGGNDGSCAWNDPGGGVGDDDSCFKYSSSDGGYITDELYNWIKAVLRNSSKSYHIIAGHEPAYPKVRHIGDSLDADIPNRDKFWNLLMTERVLAYMTAHDHWYHVAEHYGVYEADAGVSGRMVGGSYDNFATILYTHIDADGNIEIREATEQPSWASPRIVTWTLANLTNQTLVNTWEAAGTESRYYVDYNDSDVANPDWSSYNSSQWWLPGFDDAAAGFSDGELGAGNDNAAGTGWGWMNTAVDNKTTGGIYGIFQRVNFTVYNRSLYNEMTLCVDYDDAMTVWLNGVEIYKSAESPDVGANDIWNKNASLHNAVGDDATSPAYSGQCNDLTGAVGNLTDGLNLLAIGNWNNGTASSDIISAVRLYAVLSAPANEAPDVTLNLPADQTNESATSVTFNCSATDDSGLTDITLYLNGSGTTSNSDTYSTNFDSGYTTGQTIGNHADWYDGAGAMLVTSGIGVDGSVGLGTATLAATWSGNPFNWSADNTSAVIFRMDFKTDGSGGLDDDRVGWMINSPTTGSSNIFGVQIDDDTAALRIEGYWDGSAADQRPAIATLPGLSNNAWYQLQVNFTKLSDSAAKVDAALWSLTSGGALDTFIAGGSLANTSDLGSESANAKYFIDGYVYPVYKNNVDASAAADNAYFEIVYTGGGSEIETWTANETKGLTGTDNSTTFSKTLSDVTPYLWNCLATDSSSQTSWASANYSFMVNTSFVSVPSAVLYREMVNGSGFSKDLTVRFTLWDQDTSEYNLSDANITDTFPSTWTMVAMPSGATSTSTQITIPLGDINVDGVFTTNYTISSPSSGEISDFRGYVNYSYDGTQGQTYASGEDSGSFKVEVDNTKPFFDAEFDVYSENDSIERVIANDTDYTAKITVKNVGGVAAGGNVVYVWKYDDSIWGVSGISAGCTSGTIVDVDSKKAIRCNWTGFSAGETKSFTFTLNASTPGNEELTQSNATGYA